MSSFLEDSITRKGGGVGIRKGRAKMIGNKRKGNAKYKIGEEDYNPSIKRSVSKIIIMLK